MKAKELMIGDWVNWSDDDELILPCKVAELNAEELVIVGRGETAGDIVGYDDIRPIPILAEILEKNGFDKHYWSIAGEERWNYTLYYGEDKIIFSRDLTGLSIYLESEHWLHLNSINYVHQMQQALRVCGLAELAESFKIK